MLPGKKKGIGKFCRGGDLGKDPAEVLGQGESGAVVFGHCVFIVSGNFFPCRVVSCFLKTVKKSR